MQQLDSFIFDTYGIGETFGVWNFDSTMNNNEVLRVVMTAGNVIGWVPGPSLIVGGIRFFFACKFLRDAAVIEDFSSIERGREGYVKMGAILLARSILELCQIGVICMTIDVVCSLVRRVREHGLKGALKLL